MEGDTVIAVACSHQERQTNDNDHDTQKKYHLDLESTVYGNVAFFVGHTDRVAHSGVHHRSGEVIVLGMVPFRQLDGTKDNFVCTFTDFIGSAQLSWK